MGGLPGRPVVGFARANLHLVAPAGVSCRLSLRAVLRRMPHGQ
jgi:hypothetical protein